METIHDDMLIDELKKRLQDNRKALNDLRMMTVKLEKINKKLEDSEAVKSNFLSNIRNEIINPLTSIMGLSRQIATGQTDAETTKRMSHMIHNEAFDLDFQLKNIFVAAELEAGEATISISRIDLDEFITSILAAFSHRVKEKKLTIEMAWAYPPSPEGKRYFHSDADKLQQALANVLANAIEYTLPGKKVKIRIGFEKRLLTISVEDEGIGIPEDQREKLFSRFKQLDSGMRKSHRGHGLGLSITRALLDMLDGCISLSASPSGGCVFTFVVTESDAGRGPTTLADDGNEFIF